jgi:hypothetical protein
LVASGLLLTGCATRPTGRAVPNPAILFGSPEGVGTGWISLEYLHYLHARGFQVDYTNNLSDITWDRIKQYNVLVLYITPDAWDVNPNIGLDKASSPAKVTNFVVLIERYLAAGGGVFLMPREENWKKQMLSDLTDRWGAKLPLEIIVETNPADLGYLLHASYDVPLAYTDDVSPSPVSDGVKGVWYPVMPDYNAAHGGPIVVDSHWHVVVKASKTAHTQPVNLKDMAAGEISPPPHLFVSRHPVPAPALFAVRQYGSGAETGRIALVNQWPQYSIGSGLKWIYDQQVLSRGFGGKPSDFGRLLENTWHWLAAPSLKNKAVGGYITGVQTLVAPNLKKNGLVKWFGANANWTRGLNPSANIGPAYRGLMGAKTTYSSGHDTVEEFVAAAKKAGLHFIVFLDDFALLTPAKWAALKADCKRLSDDQILLLPGYTIDDNIGNHHFFYASADNMGAPWPPIDVLTGPNKTLLDLQPQNADGQYIGYNGPSFNWILYSWAGHLGNHGYYHFFGNPHIMRISDLRIYAAAAIRYYKNGKLVEDNTSDYLTTAAGTIPPAPISFNEVRSAADLEREVALGHSLTWVQARSVPEIFHAGLWWANQYASYNTFLSDGPIIHAWPQTVRVWTLGAEEFVTAAAIMASRLEVSSAAGLKEIAIYNGPELFRRFLPQGAKQFNETLFLDATVQRNLVLVAMDEKGGKAVSFARRCWKDGSYAPVFCQDHVNDCNARNLLAHGPQAMRATWTAELPSQIAGVTWDGGPPAVIPLVTFVESRPVLLTDKGREDGSRFENTPLLDYSDEGAVAVASRQNRVFAPDVLNVVNAWATFGPLDGPGKLMDFTLRLWIGSAPTVGVPETGWAAQAVREGITTCLFRSDIRFKQDYAIEQLTLLQNDASIAAVANPAYLLVGKSPDQVIKVLDYGSGKFGRHHSGTFNLSPGDWFALFSPKTACSHIFIVRSQTIQLQVNYPQINIYADAVGKKVKAGDIYSFELFSLGVPVNMGLKSQSEVTGLLTYLDQPTGMKILRGQRLKSSGLIELAAEDGMAEVMVPRPAWKTNLTLPVRVKGLNRRWSAGLFQNSGYVLRQDGSGKNRYRSLGVDEFGCGLVPMYVDLAPVTQMVVGHPVVADAAGQELSIHVMHLNDSPGKWQVAVNNLGDKSITTTMHQAMKLPGLVFPDMKLTLRPGEYRVL